MYLLDNFIKEKFLNNISLLIDQYNLGHELSTFGKLIQFLGVSEFFEKEIFEIYTEYYRINFTILEILANKQGLETHRQVFSLVKSHITNQNIKLSLIDIVNIYLSHRYRRIVISPDIGESSGLYFINPK